MSLLIAAGPVLGYNVASIVFQFLVVAFFAVIAIAIGFLVYAAKQLKARESSVSE
ncbi:MAG: hypothetical protein JXE06_01460 [Coriobacteriia bacterium]|nr:hypothetical protein [Coriobacteriia bacterium]MBN2822606.1 hypothetical protein [Coriobacteriia bacterium]